MASLDIAVTTSVPARRPGDGRSARGPLGTTSPRMAVARWGRTFRACAGGGPRWRTDGPNPAVFLDRDGTLIVDKPYCADPALLELLPGVSAALRLLQDAGYLLIVVTNQSGVARGFYDEAAVGRMHRRLNEALAPAGVTIAAYYFCPHHVDGRIPELARPCPCRKPAPGMLWRAADDWRINLSRSWLIGDLPTDLGAARAAGCQGCQVGSGQPDLLRAAQAIVRRAGSAAPAAA